MNEVLKTIAAKYKDDIVHTASELIQRNSQSLHEGEVAAYVQEKMKELGYDKVEVDRYGNVFGTMKGTGGGSAAAIPAAASGRSAGHTPSSCDGIGRSRRPATASQRRFVPSGPRSATPRPHIR